MKPSAAAAATTDACSLCAPLGACLAFRGVEGAVPFLHGSQGCGTYIRRYVIGHFHEPMDVASSSFSEAGAVFGGGSHLKAGLGNVRSKYAPALIGVATTCLSETIGDNVPMLLNEYRRDSSGAELPEILHVSTPSYSGTHSEGFHAAVRALVASLAEPGEPTERLGLLPGMVSPADLRYLKEVLSDFGLEATVLPDYSRTLDGPALAEYPRIPEGGTPLAAIRALGSARATLEFGRALARTGSAGSYLSDARGVPCHRLGTPLGVGETDRFFELLEALSGRGTPAQHQDERGRLVDAYVDGHKYLSGLRAVVYGEEDLVAGLCAFLSEVGVRPVLAASGGRGGRLAEAVRRAAVSLDEQPEVLEDADFDAVGRRAEMLGPDLLIGSSKGYALSRRLGIPLVRVGFPIHDRLGAQRILHVGYRGAQQLFDRVVNTVLERRQSSSPVGYSYM
ncbi:MAG TPA: nitrogenase component 1 [Armatimonadota bacterium]|jgi:nitrogenase molybdenum-iron protein NifN